MTALQRLTYKAAISKTHNKLDLRLQRPMISVTYFCRQKERTVTGFFIWGGGGSTIMLYYQIYLVITAC